MGVCKVCGTETKEVIKLGKMPIANGFLKDVSEDEYFFNLDVDYCPECHMVQLDETVPPEKMFHGDYQFFSSTSNAMAAFFKRNSEEIIERTKGKEDPFVVELGCNDGIMLKHVAASGIRQLGVDPSANVAARAKEQGVNVLVDFFNKQTAEKIIAEHGKADVICGSNVFCHIENINSVFEGLATLLKDDGYVYFEDPYMADIVSKSSFDQIYDEHVYYFSGLSVRELAKRHGLQLVEMKHQDVHGGSMRYYLRKGDNNEILPSVEECVEKELALKMDCHEGYQAFKNNVDQIVSDLKETLGDFKSQGNRVVAYGATSKSTTLLTYAQIGPETIDYICDTTPGKIGKFTPGMHIPVVDYKQFQEEDNNCTLLLAWNHKKEIFAKEEEYRNKGGKFITYFPKVTVE